MPATGERVLVVEGDPDISDLIVRQTLKPLGYQTLVLDDASAAIEEALETSPDLIIANLNLPGLSGKDLLTALNAQDVSIPVVVIAEKGQEQRVIQAFRLGAVDALFWPARDAEVVRVVERALQHSRGVRARHDLHDQLDATHKEMQRKVHDLTTILALSRTVVSVADQPQQLGRLLDAALKIAEGDKAWFILREDHGKNFVLRAYRNLPAGWAKKLNLPMDDGLSSLVLLSGQPLMIHGRPMEKFKVAALGKSAAVLPVKGQDQVLGALVVVRKEDRELEKDAQPLLEAIADLASIAILNSRLVRAMESSAQDARRSDDRKGATLETMRATLRDEIRILTPSLERLMSGDAGPLTHEQQKAVTALRSSAARLAAMLADTAKIRKTK